MDTNVEELKEKALAAWMPMRGKWDELDVSAKEFGHALIELRKVLCERGQMTRWMKANRIPKNRAQYCIRLAEGKIKRTGLERSEQEKQEEFFDPLFAYLSDAYAAAVNGKVQDAESISQQIRDILESKIAALLAMAERREPSEAVDFEEDIMFLENVDVDPQLTPDGPATFDAHRAN